jgi:hypothetical protein
MYDEDEDLDRVDHDSDDEEEFVEDDEDELQELDVDERGHVRPRRRKFEDREEEDV